MRGEVAEPDWMMRADAEYQRGTHCNEDDDGHDFNQREPVFDFAEAPDMHRVEAHQTDGHG